MKSVVCCPLTPVDLPAVVQLDQLCFGGLWTLAGYERELTSPNSDLFVLGQRDRGAPVSATGDRDAPSAAPLMGVGCCWAIVDEAHITLLGISPRFQGQGLGQWLLWQLLTAARDRGLQRATLEVRASNTSALSLYEKSGFQVAGRRPRYYPDGEDALILWLSGLCDPSRASIFGQWMEQSQDRLLGEGWQPSGVDTLAPRRSPHST